MILPRKVVFNILIALAGIAVGAFLTSAYFIQLARLDSLKANDDLILANLISLTAINGSDREQIKYLVEIKLAEQIETANFAAAGRGESARIARNSLKRVREWHSKNPEISRLSPLSTAVERCLSLAN